MALNKNDIDKLAWLARIKICDTDVADYLRDMGEILKLVDEMNDVDTDGIVPLAHPLGNDARLREDIVTDVDQRDRYQCHVPTIQDGCYIVPKVIE